MVVKRQLFSRRALLRGAGVVALCPLDVIAMQNAPGYGVTALLDGTGMARIPPGEFEMGSPNGNADERRSIGCELAKASKSVNARSVRLSGRL